MLFGAALDHLGDLARPPREVEAQAQRVKVAEGRDREFARRILSDALEHDVAQIIEQHPGKARAGVGEHQPDRERDPSSIPGAILSIAAP